MTSDRKDRKDLSVPNWFKERVRIVIFKRKEYDTYYIVSDHKTTRDMEDEPTIKDYIKDKQYVHIPMSFVVNDCGDMEEYAYLFVNCDCAFPPHYIVFADNSEDAYAGFLSNTDSCLIEEPDLKDYDEETITYDDNGRPMDTQSLQYYRLQPIMLVFA
jgi:hypothetical protein